MVDEQELEEKLDTAFDKDLIEIANLLRILVVRCDSTELLADFHDWFIQFTRNGKIKIAYPDWLAKLREKANHIAADSSDDRIKQIVNPIASLIEDVSYGATEAYHVNESGAIARMIQDRLASHGE